MQSVASAIRHGRFARSTHMLSLQLQLSLRKLSFFYGDPYVSATCNSCLQLQQHKSRTGPQSELGIWARMNARRARAQEGVHTFVGTLRSDRLGTANDGSPCVELGTHPGI